MFIGFKDYAVHSPEDATLSYTVGELVKCVVCLCCCQYVCSDMYHIIHLAQSHVPFRYKHSSC
jgi:hypothetical protein